MNVPHLFGQYIGEDSSRAGKYEPIITPGCEPVLEGKGEACRLYGKNGETAPFVRVLDNEPYHIASNGSIEKDRSFPLADAIMVAEMPDGLYQLIEEEVECPMCCRGYGRDGKIFTGSVGLECGCPKCGGTSTITRPRLVRVGDEKPFMDRDNWPSWGTPYSAESMMSLLRGGFHETGPFHSWHGILWRWEVECDRCDEGDAFFCHRCNEDKQCEGITCPSCGLELDYHTCDHCHGTGRITHYAKVERSLMP